MRTLESFLRVFTSGSTGRLYRCHGSAFPALAVIIGQIGAARICSMRTAPGNAILIRAGGEASGELCPWVACLATAWLHSFERPSSMVAGEGIQRAPAMMVVDCASRCQVKSLSWSNAGWMMDGGWGRSEEEERRIHATHHTSNLYHRTPRQGLRRNGLHWLKSHSPCS